MAIYGVTVSIPMLSGSTLKSHLATESSALEDDDLKRILIK